MGGISTALLALLAAVGAGAASAADNLLGLYVGAGIGESTVRSDASYTFGGYGGYGYGYDGYFDPTHHFAWKAMVGIRPLSLLGAELAYIDFGHPGSDGYNYNNSFYYGPDSHPRAVAAFGVAHVPLPVPFVDIFGKVGAARLHTEVNGFDGANCNTNQPCPQYLSAFSQNRWDTRLAYGAGVQTGFWGLSVRAEYERIDSPYGDPDVFSVGVTWTF